MAEILQFLAYGELADIFKVADSMTSLYYDNRMGCGGQEIQAAIQEHCATDNDDGKKCNAGAIFTNLFTTHLIEVMGMGTSLANALKTFELDVDKELIREEMTNIGKPAGSLLSFAFNV